MEKLFLFILFVNIQTVAFNQTIRGKILDKETEKPIYSAAVFFSGTSNGTLSDKEGNFKLEILKFRSMPLSVSAIGYYSVTIPVFSATELNTVYMAPRIFELNEVVVNDKSHARERKENLKTFRNVFLGTTVNANKCEINNENDIRFKFSANKDTLKAFAVNPILIDNKALGYSITYYLDKFEYNRRDSIFLFIGNIIFSEDFTTLGTKKMNYERARKYAYFGSRMQFLRLLWFDNLDSAHFKIMNSAHHILEPKNLISQSDNHSKYLKYHGRLDISYDKAEPSSFIVFLKDSIAFDPNGYFEPYGIRWEGDMAQQRIGDLLPYDYSVEDTE